MTKALDVKWRPILQTIFDITYAVVNYNKVKVYD